MITLATSTQKIQVLLSGAVSTTECPITCDYAETSLSTGHKTEKTALGITTGNTAVDILSAPATGIRRHVTGFSVYNADTAQVIVTVRVNDNATLRQVIVVQLQTLEALLYNESQGWYAVDVNGNRKTNAPASSGASSTALSAATSAGVAASTALSTGVSDGLAASVALSTAASDGLAASVALSTGTSDGLAASTALSTAVSDGLAASVALSANVSTTLVMSTNFSKLKSSNNGTGL